MSRIIKRLRRGKHFFLPRYLRQCSECSKSFPLRFLSRRSQNATQKACRDRNDRMINTKTHFCHIEATLFCRDISDIYYKVFLSYFFLRFLPSVEMTRRWTQKPTCHIEANVFFAEISPTLITNLEISLHSVHRNDNLQLVISKERRSLFIRLPARRGGRYLQHRITNLGISPFSRNDSALNTKTHLSFGSRRISNIYCKVFLC